MKRYLLVYVSVDKFEEPVDIFDSVEKAKAFAEDEMKSPFFKDKASYEIFEMTRVNTCQVTKINKIEFNWRND